MSVNVDFATLSKYQLLFLTSYQAYSMCLLDTDSIQSGKSIGYGLDGYDFCRYILPDIFFVNRPNPHHEQIKATWDTFFENSNGETTFGILSPFALLEMFATIEERASAKNIFSKNELDSMKMLLNDLVKGIKQFEEVSPEEKKSLEVIQRMIRSTQKARDALLKEDSFKNLAKLIENGKIRPLDKIVHNLDSNSTFIDLLAYAQKDYLIRGLDYLNYKREKSYSDYSLFYNTLDIYHYVLFDNVNELLESNNEIDAYISSSGVLSRNSWFLTKFGKFSGGITNIPSNWAGRSSDAPAYLAKALNIFNHDISQAKDFFEEGRSLSRVILRYLLSIPALVHKSLDRESETRFTLVVSF